MLSPQSRTTSCIAGSAFIGRRGELGTASEHLEVEGTFLASETAPGETFWETLMVIFLKLRAKKPLQRWSPRVIWKSPFTLAWLTPVNTAFCFLEYGPLPMVWLTRGPGAADACASPQA